MHEKKVNYYSNVYGNYFVIVTFRYKSIMVIIVGAWLDTNTGQSSSRSTDHGQLRQRSTLTMPSRLWLLIFRSGIKNT